MDEGSFELGKEKRKKEARRKRRTRRSLWINGGKKEGTRNYDCFGSTMNTGTVFREEDMARERKEKAEESFVFLTLCPEDSARNKKRLKERRKCAYCTFPRRYAAASIGSMLMNGRDGACGKVKAADACPLLAFYRRPYS